MKSAKRLRVLFTYANTSELGGADYCLLNLATALDPDSFEVHVAFGEHCILASKYESAGVRVHYVPMLRLQRTRNPIRMGRYFIGIFRTIPVLAHLIRDLEIDIVHGNDLLDFYGPIAARIMQRKAVQHVRMILPDTCTSVLLTDLVQLLNHRVVAVSDGTAIAMFQRHQKVPPKVERIYDWPRNQLLGEEAMNTDLRRELGVDDDMILIGTLGRLQYWKGQHILVQAAARLASELPNALFVIGGGVVSGRGRENYKAELSDLARDLGVDDKVKMIGNRADALNVMRSLDVFVHTAIDPEPFGLVNLEASACGLPVIASRGGGVPEIIVDGQTGLLYTPGNAVELASKIRELILLGPEGRKAMGQRGKEFVEKRFSRDKQIVQFAALYQSLVGSRTLRRIDELPYDQD